MVEHFRSSHIDWLSGYLQCLARLCGRGYVFGVAAYKANSEVDEFVSDLLRYWNKGDEYVASEKFDYCGKELIKYELLAQEIESFIFNGLLNRDCISNEATRKNITQLLTEDINECYGLLSTELNRKGVFHPLISGNVHRLNISRKGFSQEFYHLSKIENVYVVTHYTKK
ncbi:hypothetical protein [Aurantivibrio infirmus]